MLRLSTHTRTHSTHTCTALLYRQLYVQLFYIELLGYGAAAAAAAAAAAPGVGSDFLGVGIFTRGLLCQSQSQSQSRNNGFFGQRRWQPKK